MDATIKDYPLNEETIRLMIEEIIAIDLDDDVVFALGSDSVPQMPQTGQKRTA